jgi:protein-tyrosine phosphatase
MASKITNRLWLGNSTDASHPPGECNAALNCAFDLRTSANVEYNAHCGLVDGPGNPLAAYYSAIMQLHALLAQDKTVLVYCHDGQSRAVAVVILYLNAVHGQNWDHYRNFIREKHPIPDGKPHEAHRKAFEQINWRFLRDAVAR